jgi:hypothetical protein
MQQALQRSSLVPRGHVVESTYRRGDKVVIGSERPEVSACVHRAGQFRGVSMAGIGDA